jgi:hypothetical protein
MKWFETAPATHALRLALRVGGYSSAFISASTLLPGAPYLHRNLLFVPAVVTLAIIVVGVQLARQTGEPSQDALATARSRSDAPVAIRVLAALLIAGVLSSFAFLKGAPENHSGHYFANSHGTLTPLSKDEFDHQVALVQRMVSGFTGVLLLELGYSRRRTVMTKPRA